MFNKWIVRVGNWEDEAPDVVVTIRESLDSIGFDGGFYKNFVGARWNLLCVFSLTNYNFIIYYLKKDLKWLLTFSLVLFCWFY